MAIHSWTHKPEMVTDCGILSTNLRFILTIEEVVDEDRTDCADCLRSRLNSTRDRLWELEQKVERLMEER